MKTSAIVLSAIGVGLFLLVGLFVGSYNGFISQEENVDQKWAEVQNQYQRRSDLIPNLVSTVKGYASHEEDTFTSVIEARAKATAVNIDAGDLTPEKIAAFSDAQAGISSALNKLMVVAEAYPELKANENFLQLQSQLEGTENRITYARTEYNDATKEYNITIRRFPTSMVAMIFGFEKKTPFQAVEGSDVAPVVDFE